MTQCPAEATPTLRCASLFVHPCDLLLKLPGTDLRQGETSGFQQFLASGINSVCRWWLTLVPLEAKGPPASALTMITKQTQ